MVSASSTDISDCTPFALSCFFFFFCQENYFSLCSPPFNIPFCAKTAHEFDLKRHLATRLFIYILQIINHKKPVLFFILRSSSNLYILLIILYHAIGLWEIFSSFHLYSLLNIYRHYNNICTIFFCLYGYYVYILYTPVKLPNFNHILYP